jgi:hypothetical protein
MVPGIEKLTPDVRVCLAIKIMTEELHIVEIALKRRSCRGFYIGVVFTHAKIVPTFFPLTVRKLGITRSKLKQELSVKLTLCKLDPLLVFGYRDGNEFYVYLFRLGIYIEKHHKTRIPHLVVLLTLKLYKMEIALTVKDMSSLKEFITTYAVTVLTEDGVRAATHHFATGFQQSGRGITALFFAAVINDDNHVGIPFCLSDIVHSFKLVKGTRAHSVFKRIGIFVLANVDNG